MEKTDLEHFRDKLKDEKSRFEDDLRAIARVDPSNPRNWEVVSAETDEVTFHDEVADRLEELDDRQAAVLELKTRLTNILNALERTNNGTYGLCATCHQPIEAERLEANPAAATCKAHLKS